MDEIKGNIEKLKEPRYNWMANRETRVKLYSQWIQDGRPTPYVAMLRYQHMFGIPAKKIQKQLDGIYAKENKLDHHTDSRLTIGQREDYVRAVQMLMINPEDENWIS